MPTEPARLRPKAFPPPEFPPRKVPLFARTPPAVFPVILGALGLVLALRRGMEALGLSQGPVDLLAGLVVPLWVFAALAYGVKLARRPGVIWEEMKVLPGRAGLAAGTAGGLAVAAVVVPYAPEVARVVLFGGLVLHGILALVVVRALVGLPPEGRGVTPAFHLSFVGFIIGGLAAAPLGYEALARGLLWATVPVAGLIWGASLVHLLRRVPPAPLRPWLASHLAPAALFSTVAGLVGFEGLSVGFAVLGVGILLALVVAGRWVIEAGFSPMCGAFTFPLAAFASALIRLDGVFLWAGVAVLVAAIGVVPVMLWRVMKMWPGGKLAAKTNAAEA